LAGRALTAPLRLEQPREPVAHIRRWRSLPGPRGPSGRVHPALPALRSSGWKAGRVVYGGRLSLGGRMKRLPWLRGGRTAKFP